LPEPRGVVIRLFVDGEFRYGTIKRSVTRGKRSGQYVIELAKATGDTRSVNAYPEECTCPGCGLNLAGTRAKKVPGGYLIERDS
jgi:hypothetical protein